MFGIFCVILAVVGALIVIPSGLPESYGKVSFPGYDIIGNFKNGRVIDSTRLLLQTCMLLGIGFTCIFASSRRGKNKD